MDTFVLDLCIISHALVDLDISYEKFKTIVNEKEKYEKIKEDNRSSVELKKEGKIIKTT